MSLSLEVKAQLSSPGGLLLLLGEEKPYFSLCNQSKNSPLVSSYTRARTGEKKFIHQKHTSSI